MEENKGYNQDQPPAYNQPPAGAYPPQPAGVYPPQPAGAYPPQPAGAYQPQPAGGYQPGYGQPTTVIVTQPAPMGTVVMGPRPPDFLIPSVFACLCCFWPTGLCAIYYAMRANSLAGQNDMAGAQSASNTAKILMIVSIVVGVLWLGIVIILWATGSFVTYHYYRTSY